MVLLMLMALAGAVMGATIRPHLIGTPLALALAAGLRAVIGVLAEPAVDHPSAADVNQWSLALASDPLGGYIPLLGVCGGAALIAALLAMLVEPKTKGSVSLAEATTVRRRIEQGRYVRASGMVEARPLQSKAEERQKALLGL